MKHKKIIAVLLSLVLMLPAGVCANDTTVIPREQIPIDIESAEKLAEMDLFFGTEKGYELEREVTRAEALTMIDRLTGIGEYHDGYTAAPYFVDMKGHWAENTANLYGMLGYVHGTGDKCFTPERTVSGKEFLKILLSAMEYPEVSLEGAYELGVESGILDDKYSKAVVYGDYALLRSDVARISFNALTAKTYSGVYLFEQNSALTSNSEAFFYDTLMGTGASPAVFADNLDEYMPSDKNYMFSPFSIKMALALLANGASGETLKEILAVTGIENLQGYNDFSRFIIEKYARTDVIKFDIANSLWLNADNTSTNFSEDYVNTIAKYYDAQVSRVTNQNAVEEINGWVNEKTKGKIRGIINSPAFIAQLVNAIYFKGRWAEQFSTEDTERDIFTDKNGKETELDFMFNTTFREYYEDNDAKIVRLDFENPRMSSYEDAMRYTNINVGMYVILPECEFDVAKKIDAVSAQMKNIEVKLYLPKFKIESEMDNIADVLKEMGISKAFSFDAELDKIFSDGKSVPVDSIIHKTYIGVDEEGVEAAAVTAMAMGSGLWEPRPEPVEFKADRPFYFVIRDNISGEILFMGEYAYADNIK